MNDKLLLRECALPIVFGISFEFCDGLLLAWEEPSIAGRYRVKKGLQAVTDVQIWCTVLAFGRETRRLVKCGDTVVTHNSNIKL